MNRLPDASPEGPHADAQPECGGRRHCGQELVRETVPQAMQDFHLAFAEHSEDVGFRQTGLCERGNKGMPSALDRAPKAFGIPSVLIYCLTSEWHTPRVWE